MQIRETLDKVPFKYRKDALGRWIRDIKTHEQGILKEWGRKWIYVQFKVNGQVISCDPKDYEFITWKVPQEKKSERLEVGHVERKT